MKREKEGCNIAQKSIYELDAKKLLMSELPKYFPEYNYHGKFTVITPETNWNQLVNDNPWLNTEKLAAKPDQLFGKRGKTNLLLLNAGLDELKAFVNERMNKEVEIGGLKGTLNRFLVEPFVPHEKEFYIYCLIILNYIGNNF